MPAFLFAVVQANWAHDPRGDGRFAEDQLGEGGGGALERGFALKFANLKPLVAVLVLYLVVKDWSSNVIVKRFSAVVKYVIYAAAVVLTYVIEVTAFGLGDFSGLTLLGTAVTVQGVVLFAEGKNFVAKAK